MFHLILLLCVLLSEHLLKELCLRTESANISEVAEFSIFTFPVTCHPMKD